ncbi:MAG TPA: hypothetical protein PK859_19075 [Spirochaetota bacterium]|nr:hypothetical protein [Spirochaetota bacterium]HPR47718.1 hypothetical protein [Spirochaetota bacterium]
MKKQLIHILAIAVLFLAGCDTTSTTTLLNGDFLPADTSLPNILSPEEGDTVLNLTADLRWTAKEGAEYYSIEVATDGAFAQQITGSPFRVAAPNTFYKLTLPSAGTYYWRLRASVTASGQYASSYFEAKEDCLYVYFPYDPADPDAKPDDTDKTGNIDNPYQTINRAMAEAYRLGISTVKVASRGEISAGNFAAYEEYFILKDGVNILGGYNPDFSIRHDFNTGLENNPYETRLEGKYNQNITIENIFAPTLIEGITIRTENNTGLEVKKSGCELVISKSIIISNNTNYSNALSLSSTGIRVTGNIIKSGNAQNTSYGIFNQYGDPEIVNNLIISGSSDEQTSYAIYNNYNAAKPVIINNTIIAGEAASFSQTSAGLYNYDIDSDCMPIVINNIIISTDNTDTRYGIYGSGAGDINYHYNCIYGNGGTDYTGITADGTNVTGVNPNLDADYKLTASSPDSVKYGGYDVYNDTENYEYVTPMDEYLTDIIGTDRTTGWPTASDPGNGGSGWSMGAYEY